MFILLLFIIPAAAALMCEFPSGINKVVKRAINRSIYQSIYLSREQGSLCIFLQHVLITSPDGVYRHRVLFLY